MDRQTKNHFETYQNHMGNPESQSRHGSLYQIHLEITI